MCNPIRAPAGHFKLACAAADAFIGIDVVLSIEAVDDVVQSSGTDEGRSLIETPGEPIDRPMAVFVSGTLLRKRVEDPSFICHSASPDHSRQNVSAIIRGEGHRWIATWRWRLSPSFPS
jgi:hypothetical protein